METKHFLFLMMLATSLIFCSCSSDDEPKEDTFKTGQYLYETNNLTVAILFDSNVGITVYENGQYTFQSLYRNYQGKYPTYVCYFDELTMNCSFDKADSFTATVVDNSCGVNFPTTMRFVKNDKVLDINGDGILDSSQQL